MKKEVYILLSKNKIDKALELLFLLAKDKDHFNELVIQSSFYYEIRRSYRMNQISYSEYIQLSNKIVYNLLEITALIEASKNDINTPNNRFSNNENKPPSLNSRFSIILLLFMLLASFYFFIYMLKVKTETNKPIHLYANSFDTTNFDDYVYHISNR